MEGRHVLGIHKATREAIGKSVGDRVRVTLERETGERTVDVPPELEAVLGADTHFRKVLDGLAYTHPKEFARWIDGAKNEETRTRRFERTLEMLRSGATL